MRSRVFLSCGQGPEEKQVAGKIGELLKKRGFDVYIAIDVQTILEINSGIIRELKNSDCYLFVNFRRDPIPEGYRGSLFSNQELAIAFSLGFERLLVVNQVGVVPEGIVKYIAINTEKFSSFDDCCDVVERVLDRSDWTPDYSRRLKAAGLRFSERELTYGSAVGNVYMGRFLYLDVLNLRPDIAALEATARLSQFGASGKSLLDCQIRSPLKATGRSGFSHTIFPQSHEAFDLLCVGTFGRAAALDFSAPAASGVLIDQQMLQNRSVFLNTASDDLSSLPRLPIAPGVWNLRYEFFAIDFPVLSVTIELNLPDWYSPSAKILAQETRAATGK